MLVCFSWIFFRANNLSDLGILLGKLFNDFGSFGSVFSTMGIGFTAAIVAVLSVIIMTELDVITGDETSEGAVTASRKTSIVWTIWAVAAAWTMLLSAGGASTFIYFQF